MVFNSETSEATSGKGMIAAGPPRARCTKAMSTNMGCERVRAAGEGHKMKVWAAALARVKLLHKVSGRTQPSVQLERINWKHSGQTFSGWTTSPRGSFLI